MFNFSMCYFVSIIAKIKYIYSRSRFLSFRIFYMHCQRKNTVLFRTPPLCLPEETFVAIDPTFARYK